MQDLVPALLILLGKIHALLGNLNTNIVGQVRTYEITNLFRERLECRRRQMLPHIEWRAHRQSLPTFPNRLAAMVSDMGVEIQPPVAAENLLLLTGELIPAPARMGEKTNPGLS
jgi:hypothetical protein